jgi:hypothetical protein
LAEVCARIGMSDVSQPGTVTDLLLLFSYLLREV